MQYLAEKNKFIITNRGILPYLESNIWQFSSDHSVYEVIRVVDEIALFLEDHFERLISSVQVSRLQFEMDFYKFRQNITELARINQIKNGNVKFVLSKTENEVQWLFSFIPHSYPVANDYLHGVSTGLLFAERENPNAKIIQNTIRERATQMIDDQKLFEVLLVDRNGKITEGSRSNVFFVKGNQFYTAPASQVLVGITRQKVLECISELDFTLIEEAVSVSDIESFDAVFLSGTSPEVLSVNCIGANLFKANNSFVKLLAEKYKLLIKKYLAERKN